jgi:hypothetical protein
MWQWLADRPGKSKDEYFEEEDPASLHAMYHHAFCYLCEYTAVHELTCTACPIQWTDAPNCAAAPCYDLGSPYRAWADRYHFNAEAAHEIVRRAKIALEAIRQQEASRAGSNH